VSVRSARQVSNAHLSSLFYILYARPSTTATHKLSQPHMGTALSTMEKKGVVYAWKTSGLNLHRITPRKAEGWVRDNDSVAISPGPAGQAHFTQHALQCYEASFTLHASMIHCILSTALSKGTSVAAPDQVIGLSPVSTAEYRIRWLVCQQALAAGRFWEGAMKVKLGTHTLTKKGTMATSWHPWHDQKTHPSHLVQPSELQADQSQTAGGPQVVSHRAW
jgi:hypothetical protein